MKSREQASVMVAGPFSVRAAQPDRRDPSVQWKMLERRPSELPTLSEQLVVECIRLTEGVRVTGLGTPSPLAASDAGNTHTHTYTPSLQSHAVFPVLRA